MYKTAATSERFHLALLTGIISQIHDLESLAGMIIPEKSEDIKPFSLTENYASSLFLTITLPIICIITYCRSSQNSFITGFASDTFCRFFVTFRTSVFKSDDRWRRQSVVIQQIWRQGPFYCDNKPEERNGRGIKKRRETGV